MYHFHRLIKHSSAFSSSVYCRFLCHQILSLPITAHNLTKTQLADPRLLSARGRITKANTGYVAIISNCLQITDRYDNHKYMPLKPSLSFGMSWLFFLHDGDIFPLSYGNKWLAQSQEIALPLPGERKANTAETRVSCGAVTCVIWSYYELKDTLCQWQINIWLAFHLLGDIFVFFKETYRRAGEHSRKEGSFRTSFNFACKADVEMCDRTVSFQFGKI